MEKQVTIIFAGTKGFLDEFPVNVLADYEQELYTYIEANESSIFSELHEKEEISDKLDEKIRKTLTAFGETFKATKGLN
jgi:F-type H+-transporting ATPase subunit alpha